MIITNYQIVQYAENLKLSFMAEDNNDYIPVQLDYIVQTNLAELIQNYISIDKAKEKIYKYSKMLPENEVELFLNKELQFLYNIELDIPLHFILLNTILDLNLTTAQMEAILFMIKDNGEKGDVYMRLTNQEIYSYALALNNAFTDNTQKLPVRVNFYLQKNKALLTSLGQNLEESRMKIIHDYGELSEDGVQYIIPKDKIEEAQKELNDLFTLEQEVNIYKINIDSLPEDISLTTGQMEAIMFMID